MEKIMIWFLLSLKEYLKKRGTWLSMIGSLFLLWIVMGISVPDYKNMKVGFCMTDSLYADSIKEELVNNENSFLFIEYQNEELLQKDIINGIIDCGFVFLENFDEKVENRETKNSIRYISTSFSDKGEVVKEKVYAAFFKIYSENILERLEYEIFGNHKEERLEQIIDKKRIYQEGTEVFQMKITEVNAEPGREKEEISNNSLRGLIGLVIFLTMFVSYGSTQLKEGDNVEAALSKKEQFFYRYVKMIAASFLISLVGFLLLLGQAKDKNILQEVIFLVCYILLCAAWVSFVGRGLGRMEYLPLWITALIVVHLIICPVFFDFSIYVPGIKWIRYVLPLTWYLKFF